MTGSDAWLPEHAISHPLQPGQRQHITSTKISRSTGNHTRNEHLQRVGTMGRFNSLRADRCTRVQMACFQKVDYYVSAFFELVGERGFEPPTPWSRTVILRSMLTYYLGLIAYYLFDI